MEGITFGRNPLSYLYPNKRILRDEWRTRTQVKYKPPSVATTRIHRLLQQPELYENLLECPSEKALQNISAGGAYEEKVASLLGDYGDDYVFLIDEAAAEDPFFQSELAYATQDSDVPRTYAQIFNLPDEEREKWLQACRRECASHLAIPSVSRALTPQEWTKTPPVRLTWVFAKKDVYKARIVMLGQRMVEGVHFNDTHAPVPSVTCIRAILAITAATRRNLTQLDVKTAFLNAPIDIELDVIPGCPQSSRV